MTNRRTATHGWGCNYQIRISNICTRERSRKLHSYFIMGPDRSKQKLLVSVREISCNRKMRDIPFLESGFPWKIFEEAGSISIIPTAYYCFLGIAAVHSIFCYICPRCFPLQYFRYMWFSEMHWDLSSHWSYMNACWKDLQIQAKKTFFSARVLLNYLCALFIWKEHLIAIFVLVYHHKLKAIFRHEIHFKTCLTH